MWLSKRFSVVSFFLLVATFSLGACGFQPLYAKPNAYEPAVGAHLSKIKVGHIPDRIGQQMRNLLVERLNPVGEPGAPFYTLTVSMTESLQELGIERDTSVTFARLIVSANYRLVDRQTQDILLESTARSTNSYNVVESPYATLVAEQDARERAIRQIADDIRLRLASYFKRAQQAPGS